jgi:nucleoside-diphosphate-sugar epimerase
MVNGKPGEAYKIGVEGPEISIMDLANRVTELSKDLFGYKGKVVKKVSEDKEYLTDNPNRRCPIITKAREEIGYNPSIGIDEGLKRSMIWYKDNNEAEDA